MGRICSIQQGEKNNSWSEQSPEKSTVLTVPFFMGHPVYVMWEYPVSSYFYRGADLHAVDEDGLTPLQVAANARSLDTIVAVLERLRNLDQGTTGGKNETTAADLLEWAAREDNAETLEVRTNSKLLSILHFDFFFFFPPRCFVPFIECNDL